MNRGWRLFALALGSVVAVLALAIGPQRLTRDATYGVTNVSASEKPVRLIDGFYSYQTVKQVQENLRKRAIAWRIEDDTHARGSGSNKHRTYDLHIARFRDLDHDGDLTLRFLDDRLLGAMFSPGDFAGYVKQLEMKEGLVFDRPSPTVGVLGARTDGARSVWANRMPPRGAPFIGWVDTRMQREWNSAFD